MTNKRWLLAFLAAILVCSAVLLWQTHAGQTQIVSITQDGQTLYTIDLSQVQQPYTLTIPYNGHYNLVQVTRETVWVSDADCGNQVCVEHGPLETHGTPITCLPHHLMIQWASDPIVS